MVRFFGAEQRRCADAPPPPHLASAAARAAGAGAMECLVEATPAVREALRRATEAAGGQWESQVQAQADGRDFVRAGALAEACAALRAAGDDGAYLHVVARGADVHVPQADADIASAKARAQAAPSMSEERRRALLDADEQRQYDAMVSDVTSAHAGYLTSEPDGDGHDAGGYRTALALGTNMVAVLGTLAAFGGACAPHVIGEELMPRGAAQAVGAAGGIVLGLLVETLLFVVRETRIEREGADASKAS